MSAISYYFLDGDKKLILEEDIVSFIDKQLKSTFGEINIALEISDEEKHILFIKDEVESIILRFCFESIVDLTYNSLYTYNAFSHPTDYVFTKHISSSGEQVINVRCDVLSQSIDFKSYNEFAKNIYDVGEELLSLYKKACLLDKERVKVVGEYLVNLENARRAAELTVL